MKHLKTIALCLLVFLTSFGISQNVLASTITVMNGSDTLSASRSVINTNFANLNTDKLESTNIDTCAELASILSGNTTGSCGTFVLSVAPTFTGKATFANSSTTLASFSYASSTDLRAGTLRIPSLSDGCLNITSGVVGSSGSACGTGSGGSGSVATSTAETSGYIPFATSNSATPATIGFDSAFYWDNTNKFHGIGTSTPGWKTQIVQGSQTSTGYSGGLAALAVDVSTSSTAVPVNVLEVRAVSTGTKAAGFGPGIIFTTTSSNSFSTNSGPLSAIYSIDGSSGDTNLTFETGSASVRSERARLNFSGFGYGTTTPRWPFTGSKSTGPQLGLTDASATNYAWTLRAINNSLFFATSTYSATSTVSALSIDPNGVITVPSIATGVVKSTSGVLGQGLASLTSDITGTLGVANGGTGSTTLTGLLKGNGTSLVQTAVAGTDYLAPASLTATYPVQYSANTISLAFGTTTANTWSSYQNYTYGINAALASSTNATTTGSQYFTGITASRPLYVDSAGKLGSAGSGTSGNCVQWAANNTLGDAGAACGTGGGASDFTFSSTYGAVNAATSSKVWFQDAVNASSTIRIKTNTLSTHSSLGFFDVQRDAQTSGNGYTLMRIKAPTGASQESTLSLLLDYDNNNAGVNERFIDFYTEHYADSDQSGIRIFQTGTAGLGNSFMFGWKLEAGSKDSQNVGGFFPNGGWLIGGPATTTQTAATLLTISSTTATNLLDVKAGAGASRLMVLGTGNVGIGTTSPFTKLAVAGTITADNINATTTATSTFAGSLIVGSSATAPLSLGGYIHPYLRVGTTTCAVNPTFYSYLEVCGSDNTTNGVQAYVANNHSGTSAFAGYSLGNDKALNNTTNYAGIFLNSSTYTDTTFGTGNAIPYMFQVGNTMGPVSIQAATSAPASAYVNVLVGGVATGNEIARFNTSGLGIGTTTPKWSLNIASSTGPQIALSDGTLTSNPWTFRSINGSFYLATASPSTFATSSVSAFSIDTNGLITMGRAVISAVLRIPVLAALSLTTDGDFGIDTTDNQIQYRSGSATRVLTPNIESAFVFASSTLGAGTTTIKVSGFPSATTFTKFGCTSSGSGTFVAVLGDSTSSTTPVVSGTSNTTTFTTMSSNNAFTAGEAVWYAIGSVSGTVINPTCSYQRTTDAT